MIIENISNELFKSNEDNINDLLKYNFDKTMLDKLYFIPKNINKNIVNDKLTNKSYIEKVMKTINFFKGKNIENIVLEKIKYFENNINSKITNGKNMDPLLLEDKNYYINYIIRKNELTLKYNYFKIIKEKNNYLTLC